MITLTRRLKNELGHEWEEDEEELPRSPLGPLQRGVDVVVVVVVIRQK